MGDFERSGAFCIGPAKTGLFVSLLFGLGALLACSRATDPAAPPLGSYRGVLSIAGGDLPFGLELAREDGAAVAYLINGPERVRATKVQLDGTRLSIRMPGYQNRLEAEFKDARFEGTVQLLRPRGVIKSVRFVGMPGQAWRFFPKPDLAPADFSGRWALTFRGDDGSERAAIAELQQRDHEVWGTVLRASGDDRGGASEALGAGGWALGAGRGGAAALGAGV